MHTGAEHCIIGHVVWLIAHFLEVGCWLRVLVLVPDLTKSANINPTLIIMPVREGDYSHMSSQAQWSAGRGKCRGAGCIYV